MAFQSVFILVVPHDVNVVSSLLSDNERPSNLLPFSGSLLFKCNWFSTEQNIMHNYTLLKTKAIDAIRYLVKNEETL